MSDPTYIFVGFKHVGACQISFNMSTFKQFKGLYLNNDIFNFVHMNIE